MYISDDPLLDPIQDKLNRKDFAKAVTTTLLNWDSKDCKVLAIDAKWGHGKTSVLNMIRHCLSINGKTVKRKSSRIRFNGKEIYLIDYNPWSLENKDRIDIALVESVAKSLCQVRYGFYYVASFISNHSSELNTKHSISSLTVFVALIAVVGLSSIINTVGLYVLFSILMLQFIAVVLTICLAPLKSKAAIQSKLTGNKRMIVFIDDIDRLSSNEILSLLRVIRINTDFQNCIYVLAMDTNVVSSMIQEQGYGKNGFDFIEKIVQVDLPLPIYKDDTIRHYVISELQAFVNDNQIPSVTKQFSDQSMYWYRIETAGLWSCLGTLRNAKRYLNILFFLLIRYSNKGVLEINALDLLAIEAIRAIDRKAYDFIKRHKRTFCNLKESYYDPVEARTPKHLGTYKKWIENVSAQTRPMVDGLIQVLFPQLNEAAAANFEVNDQDSIRNLRINTEEHFDKYFAFDFSNSGDQVQQYDLETVLKEVSTYQILRDTFETHHTQGTLNQLLTRLDRSITSDYVVRNPMQHLLQVLFDVSDKVSYEFVGVFESIEVDRVFYFILTLLQKTGATINDNVLPNLIINSESIYMPVRLIVHIAYSDTDKPYYVPIVSSDAIDQLKDAAATNIQTKQDKLLDHPRFSMIFDFWFAWSKDKSELIKYRDSIYIDDDKLITMLDRIQGTVHASNQPEPMHYFELTDKSKTHDIDVIYNRVLELSGSKAELTVKNVSLLNRFIYYYENYYKQGKKVDTSNLRESI